MTYSAKLKNPKWQKKRLKILERDGWKCTQCGDTENELHVHHLKYTEKLPHNEPDENLQTLCAPCHEMIEVFKKDGIEIVRVGCLFKENVGKFYAILCSDGNVYFKVFSIETGLEGLMHGEFESFYKIIQHLHNG